MLGYDLDVSIKNITLCTFIIRTFLLPEPTLC
jgi:hypothetical protein